MSLSREEMSARRQTWAQAGFPPRHADACDEIAYTPSQLPKVADAQRVVDDRGLLALVGGRGGGKTQLATVLARWFTLSTGRSSRYDTAFVALQDLKRRSYEEGKGGTEALAPLVNPGLLVLDEVQEIRNSDDDARWLTALLDKRYQHRSGTILIANLTAEELMSALGPSIASRMVETGRVVKVDWPSMRKPSPPPSPA